MTDQELRKQQEKVNDLTEPYSQIVRELKKIKSGMVLQKKRHSRMGDLFLSMRFRICFEKKSHGEAVAFWQAVKELPGFFVIYVPV